MSEEKGISAMRALKIFSITLCITSLVLFIVYCCFDRWQSTEPWITAEMEEIKVSVKDERSSWLRGMTAGVRDDATLTDRIRLTHLGRMTDDDTMRVIFSVTDDLGRSASFIRTIRFRDYSPPEFRLLRAPEFELGADVVLNELIMVIDPIEGDITHKVKMVSSNLNTSKAGTYEVLLTVENCYGVSVDYTLTITII